MSIQVITKSYPAPAVSKKEILRYAKAAPMDGEALGVLAPLLEEAMAEISYKTVCLEVDFSIRDDNICDFGVFSVKSNSLAKKLGGCKRVIILAATLGIGIDRLIYKYGKTSPTRGLFMQAIGAERIEALCDALCNELKKTRNIRPRFSPGYGDLTLDIQKDIFRVLDAPKHIGASLTDSMLISPTKTVTAFIGIEEEL
jgi:hypothetical protein